MADEQTNPVAELAEMLDQAQPYAEGGFIFDHTPEEIGLHVMENWQAIRAVLPSKAQSAFIDAIRAAAPHGEAVSVRLHENGDWSVFDRAAPAGDEVEAVARALARRNYPGGSAADIDEMWEGFTEDARAAIAALQAPSADLEANLSATPEELIAQARPLDLPAEPAGKGPCAECGRGEGHNLHAPFGDAWHEFRPAEPAGAELVAWDKLAEIGITSWRQACEWMIELDEIHVGDVWAWEQNHAVPTDDKIVMLAELLEVPAEALRKQLFRGHEAVVGRCRKEIAASLGVSPDVVKIMLEL